MDAEGIFPTEREFDRATASGRERLIFVKGPDVGRDPRMAALVVRARWQLIRRRFTDVSEPTTGLYASLVDFLERQGDIFPLPFDASGCPRATLDDLSEEAGRRYSSTRSCTATTLPMTRCRKCCSSIGLKSGTRVD